MSNKNSFRADYSGTKAFDQLDVYTANATGFGAASDDYAEKGIDLNEVLVMNKPATFFLRMGSDAMAGAGVVKGDVLVVDRSIKAKQGKIVVACLNGEMLVRYLNILEGCHVLTAANNSYSNKKIESIDDYKIWGVVTCAIHLIDPVLRNFHADAKITHE